MASVDERNQRLDQLVQATTAWADKRTLELKNRVAIAKALLKGRTGSERLASATTKAASDLVINEIDDFLLASS